MPENETADTLNDVLVLEVPYSDLSRFDTTGRMKELAKPGEPRKPSMNPVKRFVISTLGIFFLMVGFIGFDSSQNLLISISCIFFGILIIWTFIAWPEMQRRKAAPPLSNGKNPEVSITFNKNTIVLRSPYNQLKKDWSELAEHKKTKKGFHFTFTDGIEAYLPLDVFYEGELKTLTTLLQNKKII